MACDTIFWARRRLKWCVATAVSMIWGSDMHNYSPPNMAPISKKRPRSNIDTAPELAMPGAIFTICDESVRNLSTNLLRRLSGEYKFAFISNQLQKEVWDI
ncbi:hypothetical protein TNCV_3547561 [Trichonephila clavipes]|nr:hypothetical protein TNCV_3547561 [Trichonephila clavipes]